MSAELVLAGRYRLLHELGHGGMGVVWQARDEMLGRDVAVKEVRAPVVLEDSEVRQLYTRLEREGRAAARVSHRNVVTVFDVIGEDGRPWIVMELVHGLSLAEVLDAEGPVAPQRAAAIGAEVLSALRAAHSVEVLHRDVKPGNILLGNDGRVVLTDFGIAMVAGASSLTLTGEVVGSPEYLAPERALGNAPSPASDLWSLGVTLYAAVEGRTPFRQLTPLSTLRAVVDQETPLPPRAGPLTPVLEGLLRKDPEQRLGAEEAERMLRIVAAGGTAGSGSPPLPPLGSVPMAPVPGESPPEGSAPSVHPAPGPVPAQPYAGYPVTPTPTPSPAAAGEPTSRAVWWVVAGAVIAVLLAVGLAWALVSAVGPGGGSGGERSPAGPSGGQDEGAGDREGGGPHDDGRGGPSEREDAGPGDDGGGGAYGGTDGSSRDGHGEGGDGGDGPDDGPDDDRPDVDGDRTTGNDPGSPGGTGGTSSTTSPPRPSAQATVTVTVRPKRTDYSGSCPPPAGEAPAFTATFTVDRGPAEVRYRWITGSGETSDPRWRTVGFPAGGQRQISVDHIELSHEPDGELRDWIGITVRSPRQVESNRVDFTVTCESQP